MLNPGSSSNRPGNTSTAAPRATPNEPARRHGARLPRLTLTRNLLRSIHGGHPWVYRESLAVPPGVPTGAVVDLVDKASRFVARGLYDAESPLALRVWTLDPEESVDGTLIQRRLAAALAARRGALLGGFAQTNAFRLCNGEGDFLPGLTVDVYGHIAVVICDGEAVQTLLPQVVSALLTVGEPLGITAIYERHQRRQGGGGQLLHGSLQPASGQPRGTHAGEVLIREHGMQFVVDIQNGQKTGLFLDQRENRRLIGRYAAGLSVWNGFAYTGGFSLAAALGGATRVVTVDRAPVAIEAARRNFALNGLDPQAHGFFADDVFTHLETVRAQGLTYDMVIVDPPSFAPTAKALPAALAAYRDLHRLAMEVVAPGGLLVAASCSSHVPETAFLGTLVEAAAELKRRCRVLEIQSQPADHPHLPAFPEGRYLKCILLRMD
jgi:23S rRNA (cytosine1962-C5)-methyltransferase